VDSRISSCSTSEPISTLRDSDGSHSDVAMNSTCTTLMKAILRNEIHHHNSHAGEGVAFSKRCYSTVG
jgi:hypothetical protein